MYKYGIVLLALVCAAWGESCGPYPNSTETKLNFYNCNNDNVIQTSTISITDGNGNVNYPVDLKKALVISAVSVNKGETYEKTLSDVVIYKWTQKLFGNDYCKWFKIPTFNLLNNLDGCKLANNCPLKPGELTIRTEVDISQFGSLIGSIVGGSSYMLEIHTKDAANNKPELACLKVQVRVA